MYKMYNRFIDYNSQPFYILYVFYNLINISSEYTQNKKRFTFTEQCENKSNLALISSAFIDFLTAL